MSRIIVATPEQLADTILEAVRAALPAALQNTPPPGVRKKKLLSAKDVEKEYGIQERTLERWRGEGVGPVYTTIGRRIYYERELLDQFIAEGRVRTTGKADY